MRARRLLLLVTAVALVGVACGGDDSSNGEDERGAATTTAVDATATEFAFDPASWTVPAGASVTINLDNQGVVEHNILVVGAGLTVSDSAQVGDGDIVVQVFAQPGASATGTFTAPAAGTYQVICSIPGHLAAGMKGELTVTP